MSDHTEKFITPVVEDDKKLEKYKNDVARDAEVADDQRYAANEDMRFIHVDGGMWEGVFEDLGNRVKLELDMVSDYVQRFIGEWNLNRVGVDFKPDDDKTNDDDADLINGIYRADFRQSKGKLATDNAVDEVATCGYGAFKLGTFFIDEGDPENFDKRIEWRPIYNAYNTVIWDQAAKDIDKSDARWCTELTAFTSDEFEAAYPDLTASSAYDPETFFSNRNFNAPNFIYIASRYEVVRERRTVFVYDNLKSGLTEVYEDSDHEEIKSQLEADDIYQFKGKRRLVLQHVTKTVFSGDDILEETRRIAGKWIPIIPFYGYRAYVDGVETYRGLVRKLKDAQRLFNMMNSQFAETSATNGQEVPIFTSQQMENPDIVAAWADRNNKPYLIVDPHIEEGQVIATGPIGYLKPPQLDGSTVALAQTIPEHINRITGGAPQDTLDPDASGKAIRALMKRENMTTQIVNDNIASGVAWSGTVYQSMAAEEYNTQRRMKILGKDGVEGEKQLFQTVMDPDSGTLIEINTLEGKRFHSYSDTGPQYETMREETVETLKGMLPILQDIPGGEQYIASALAALVDNMTGTGLESIKSVARRVMLLSGSVKPENDEEEQILAQAQAQAQQPDPDQELKNAIAQEQLSESRERDTKSIDNLASAGKKEAETVQIHADIETDQAKITLQQQKQLNEQRANAIKALESFPVPIQ